jgi:hypothetical protein
MHPIITAGYTLITALSVLVLPYSAFGMESSLVDLGNYSTVRFNNENWHTLPHPRVASFSVADDGSASGITEDGRLFSQYMVPNPYGIRVQRFEIEDHYHFIVEGEIADSFTEFSALLALAYERTLTT